VNQLNFGEGPFLQTVAETLRYIAGESVSPQDFQLDKLPQHLHLNVRVIDDKGKTLSSARDLEQLQAEWGPQDSAGASLLQHPDWNRDGITTWDFGDLPRQVDVTSGGITLTVYPMLVDCGTDVALRLADTPSTATRKTRAALRRLLWLSERSDLRSQVSWLPRLDQMKLYAATVCGAAALEQQLAELVADRAFLDEDPAPHNATDYQRLLERGRARMGIAVDEVARLVRPLLESYHQARLALEEARQPNWKHAVDDMWEQLSELTPAGFLSATPWNWLQHNPRYLEAIRMRLEKLASSGWVRDYAKFEQLLPFLMDYRQRVADHRERGIYDEQLVLFRWMLEEFRVSLFAQELRTSIPVSAKRLQRQWSRTAK
jgi:ATP-dependent helicase HrpA